MAKQANETTQLWALIQEWMDAFPYPPTQNKFAKRVGVAGTAVSQWKYGQSRPTPANIQALADEMSSVMGPDIHQRLLDALLVDMGYAPEIRGVETPVHDAIAQRRAEKPSDTKNLRQLKERQRRLSDLSDTTETSVQAAHKEVEPIERGQGHDEDA